MKTHFYLIVALLPFSAGAEELPVPAQLSAATAANIATLSSELSRHFKSANQATEARSEAIVDVHHLAAASRARVDHELNILANTNGTALSKSFTSIVQQGDAAAAQADKLAAIESDIRKDLAAATAPATLSTEKLDATARKLAVLAEAQSKRDRIKELYRFAKDTKESADKLEEKAGERAAKAGESVRTQIDTQKAELDKSTTKTGSQK